MSKRYYIPMKRFNSAEEDAPSFFKTKSSGVVNQDGIALSCDSKDCYQLGWLNKACDGFGSRKKDRSATQCSMGYEPKVA